MPLLALALFISLSCHKRVARVGKVRSADLEAGGLAWDPGSELTRVVVICRSLIHPESLLLNLCSRDDTNADIAELLGGGE